MNNLIEMGSDATVIIRAICDFDTYKQGDILSVINHVFVDFVYSPRDVAPRVGAKYVLAYYDKHITGLTINNIPLTSSLLSLFQNMELSDDYIPSVTKIESFIYNAEENNNTYYLALIPEDSSNIQIVPNVPYTYYERNNSIVLEELTDETEYNIFYTKELNGPVVNLNKNIDIPYVDIEIQYEGNQDKNSTTAVLRFPRVKLKDVPQLNLSKSNVSNYSISGDIIYDENDVVLMGLTQSGRN